MKVKGFGINGDALKEDGFEKNKFDLNRLARNLEHFAEMEFEFVEIPMHRLEEMSDGSFSLSHIEKTRKILSSFPFKYTVHGPDPMGLKNKEDVSYQKKTLKKSLEFAHALEAEILVFHAGKYAAFRILNSAVSRRQEFNQRTIEEMLALEREILYSVAEKAQELGVIIGLENVQPYIDRSPYCYSELLSLLRKQVEEINHPNVGITLDVGHAFLSASFYRINFLEEISKALSHVCHIHLHDNFGRVSKTAENGGTKLLAKGYGDLHLPIGCGSVPAENVLHLIRDCPCVVLHELHFCTREQAENALKFTDKILSRVA